MSHTRCTSDVAQLKNCTHEPTENIVPCTNHVRSSNVQTLRNTSPALCIIGKAGLNNQLNPRACSACVHSAEIAKWKFSQTFWNSANVWMCQILGVSLFLGQHTALWIKVQLSCPEGGLVSRPVVSNHMYANSCELGCISSPKHAESASAESCINCQLGKLTRVNLLTCLAVLIKVFFASGAQSSMPSSSVMGSTAWCAFVSASPNNSEPQASLIIDDVRFVILDVQMARLIHLARPLWFNL